MLAERRNSAHRTCVLQGGTSEREPIAKLPRLVVAAEVVGRSNREAPPTRDEAVEDAAVDPAEDVVVAVSQTMVEEDSVNGVRVRTNFLVVNNRLHLDR